MAERNGWRVLTGEETDFPKQGLCQMVVTQIDDLGGIVKYHDNQVVVEIPPIASPTAHTEIGFLLAGLVSQPGTAGIREDNGWVIAGPFNVWPR